MAYHQTIPVAIHKSREALAQAASCQSRSDTALAVSSPKVNELAHHRANVCAAVGTTQSHNGKVVSGQITGLFACRCVAGLGEAFGATQLDDDKYLMIPISCAFFKHQACSGKEWCDPVALVQDKTHSSQQQPCWERCWLTSGPSRESTSRPL